MKIFEFPLFQGINEEEQEMITHYGCMRKRFFEKNKTIFHMGDRICEIGMVLSGSVHIENTDLWGNRSILSNVVPGQIFAETYALSREPMMVNVVTVEPSEILFLNLELLLHTSHSAAAWQSKITENLLHIFVQKNLILSHRIFCTTPKTIRGRLLIYLSEQSAKAGSTTFQIPFNRQGLADYLNLDRSALSKELGKMRDEGIIDFHKNTFTMKIK